MSREFVARFAQADASTKARLEAGCKFINHKIEELRRQFLLISTLVLIAAFVLWQATGIDFRVPLVCSALVIGFTHMRAQRELARWYKRMVTHRVVDAVGQDLKYSQESSFERAQFRAIDLFRERIDQWKSEDQITGRRNAVDYALHEVRASRREQQGKRTRTVTVFRGIVAVLEFNKHFYGHTVVVPARDGKLLGGLLGEANSRGGKQLVGLPDPEFEKVFAVYSSDDQEAHYLLTPKLIELVRHAHGRFGDIRLAFYQSSLYITVPSNRDRFEVGLFGKVTPATALNELADVVGLAEQLIDVLDLETRIWTRT